MLIEKISVYHFESTWIKFAAFSGDCMFYVCWRQFMYDLCCIFSIIGHGILLHVNEFGGGSMFFYQSAFNCELGDVYCELVNNNLRHCSEPLCISFVLL